MIHGLIMNNLSGWSSNAVPYLLHAALALTLTYGVLLWARPVFLADLVHYISDHLLIIDPCSCPWVLLLIDYTHDLAYIACTVDVWVIVWLVCEGVVNDKGGLVNIQVMLRRETTRSLSSCSLGRLRRAKLGLLSRVLLMICSSTRYCRQVISLGSGIGLILRRIGSIFLSRDAPLLHGLVSLPNLIVKALLARCQFLVLI